MNNVEVKYILICGGEQKEKKSIKDINDEYIKEIQIDCHPLGLLGQKEFFDDEAMLKIAEIKKNAITCACQGNCSNCTCKELDKMCNQRCHKGKVNINCSRKIVGDDSEDSEAKRPKLDN